LRFFAAASASALGLVNIYFVSHHTEFAQKKLHKKTSSGKACFTSLLVFLHNSFRHCCVTLNRRLIYHFKKMKIAFALENQPRQNLHLFKTQKTFGTLLFFSTENPSNEKIKVY
jgi:hypothetical protein